MWEWLFGRKRPESKRGQDPPQVGPSESLPGFTGAAPIGPLVEEMKAKGYQGPFANLCDGIMVVTFHGPRVSLEPAWIEPAGNPFQMRVLNCEAFCRDSPMFALGEGADAINARFTQARADPRNSCQPHPIPDAQKTPCLLSYPRGGEQVPDGAHFVAEAMEDLWNIFLFDGHFYFTRSWTGHLRYRAKLLFRPGGLFVTEVEASRTRPPNDLYRHLEDEELPVRQVDFLIKALLYRLQAPAPLPRGLSKEKPGALALFSLTEYGRWGWFPAIDDTTEYRICLNGVKGRFPPRPKDTLLPAIKAVEERDIPANRQKLLEELRGHSLFFAFSIAEEELRKGPVTDETPVQFLEHEWRGTPCAFAYTDPAFRVESSQGCLSIGAAGFWELVGKKNERACLVINPGGPATCIIEPAEMKALAQ
jgi:hypothetical protein